ncbi:MAG: bifunctional methionine sulfoxide reductase B/A protein [Candidatus Kapabacteria bacterium]|nr:bifunctional methionine sulfoxide reductase B/A protein [Candidatus Kapabacteria bacterium]
MNFIKYALILNLIITIGACSMDDKNLKNNLKLNELNAQERRVIIDKGTESPYSGQYWNSNGKGTYTCRQCNYSLYKSTDKFDSRCGWPSFDDEIPGAVRRQLDADGQRTEILCAHCGGHLGHVFEGELLTDKNIRHCVNSISIQFVPDSIDSSSSNIGRALFASGCFWGTEYFMQAAKGVIKTTVGYTGGHTVNPTYKEVCTGSTGHAETVEVLFDKSKTNFEELAKLFFETHDPAEVNRQGPDIGSQYRTAIFYTDDDQKDIALKLKAILEKKGLKVATEITKSTAFYKAEDYHQQYYKNNGKRPYCHFYTKRF